MTVTVRVGFAVARPPAPHNIRFSTITVTDVGTETEATLLAAQWAASRPGVVMPTSTEILSLVL